MCIDSFPCEKCLQMLFTVKNLFRNPGGAFSRHCGISLSPFNSSNETVTSLYSRSTITFSALKWTAGPRNHNKRGRHTRRVLIGNKIIIASIILVACVRYSQGKWVYYMRWCTCNKLLTKAKANFEANVKCALKIQQLWHTLNKYFINNHKFSSLYI